jgi:NRPS condensation-like uncharacterized protein
MQGQMEAAKQNWLGLTHPLVRWELNRTRRLLFNCIPFRVLKRVTRRRMRALKERDSPSRLIFSNVGSVDPDRLTFDQVGAAGCFLASGILTNKEMLLMGATQYRGRWTFVCGFSPRHVDEGMINRFLDETVASLPCETQQAATPLS